MKTLLAISLLLGAVNAHACPDLSGTYNYSPDGSITLAVVQQACSQITFTIAVAGTVATEVDHIDGLPVGQGDGSYNTFQFTGDTLVVTPVTVALDGTVSVIPGSYSTYSLTAAKDMQYSLEIATDTPNPFDDVTIYKRVSN